MPEVEGGKVAVGLHGKKVVKAAVSVLHKNFALLAHILKAKVSHLVSQQVHTPVNGGDMKRATAYRVQQSSAAWYRLRYRSAVR